MKKDEAMSLYEQICDYEVLEEKQMDGYRKAVLKTKAGIVDLRIPNHAPEEEEKLSADITRALFEFAFPGEDWSKIGTLRIMI